MLNIKKSLLALMILTVSTQSMAMQPQESTAILIAQKICATIVSVTGVKEAEMGLLEAVCLMTPPAVPVMNPAKLLIPLCVLFSNK